MLHQDLRDMLKGLKAKLYHKTFKKITKWDENFMSLALSTVQSCVNKIDAILVQSSANPKATFEGYVDIRESLALTLGNVNFI